MATRFDTKCPPELTNAAWQKKKNVLDKGIKTGIGEKLLEIERKWKEINWTVLDVGRQCQATPKATSSQELMKLFNQAGPHRDKASKLAQVLKDFATSVRTKSGDKRLSKVTAGYAQTIAFKADTVRKLLKDIQLYDYEIAIDKAEKQEQERAEKLKAPLAAEKAKFLTGLKNLEGAVKLLTKQKKDPHWVWRQLRQNGVLPGKTIEICALAAMHLIRGSMGEEKRQFQEAEQLLREVEQEFVKSDKKAQDGEFDRDDFKDSVDSFMRYADSAIWNIRKIL